MSEQLRTTSGDLVAFDLHGTGADGEGPAVVFVAGAGPWRQIDPETTATAQRLAEAGRTAIVHDRLGRGESPVSGPVHAEREVAAIAALVERAGGSAVLVGHSSGCHLALRAVADGVPASGLVLWEPPLDPDREAARGWVAEVVGLLDDGRTEEAVATYMRDIPAEILGGLRDSPLWADFVAQGESLRPDCEVIDWLHAAPLADVLAERPELDLPVTVCHGRETYDTMRASTAALAAALPRATAAVVEGAQHGWEPDAMAELILSVRA